MNQYSLKDLRSQEAKVRDLVYFTKTGKPWGRSRSWLAPSRFWRRCCWRYGSTSIEGTSDRAVSVSHGVFTNWAGTLEIKNLNGGPGFDFFMSQGNIKNLKMQDSDNMGSGWNPALNINTNSSLDLERAEISGSTDGNMINISDGSAVGI